MPDPDNEGSYCSRKNLLQGNRHPFPLERLMAFGTAATCYVPKERRDDGKSPSQRRSFHGVIMGYEDGMPAYRIYDLETHTIKKVSYNFTICHEGFYPFKDKKNLPTGASDGPLHFAPTTGSVMSPVEYKKFSFSPEEEEEVRGNPAVVVMPEPVTERPTDACGATGRS